MEMLEQSLDASESKPGSPELSTSQDLETDEGSSNNITYRVIHIGSGSDAEASQAQILTQSGLTQVISSNSYSNSSANSPTHGDSPARFTYVATNNSEVQGNSGQYFVMMSPQDVIQNTRTIAPSRVVQTRTISGDNVKSSRDERRRATHNEVERRRRDKINNWIVQLSKLIPDYGIDGIKGQVTAQSKGGILSKACDYIEELRSNNLKMSEAQKEIEHINMDREVLRQQVEELKAENAILRQTLADSGIAAPTDFSS